MALGPVVFYMLNEFRVPGRVGLIAVFPVDDEFRQQRAGKIRIDMGQHQNIEHVFGRIPLFGDSLGFRAVFQRGGVLRPLDSNVLNKL